MDPTPPILKIFSYLVQQERQLIGNNFLSNSEVKTIAAINTITCSFCGKNAHTDNKNGFSSNKNNSNKKTCTHCGKFEHTVDVCYKKHGYPPGHFVRWKNKDS